MSANLGSATFHFKGDSSNLDKTTQGLNSKLGNIAKGIGGAFVKGTAIATTALTGLVTAGVNSFADLEQNVGGIETLFKDSADKVIKNAENAYMTAGMSANQYMETVTSFSASLLQGLGGDTEKASQYADMAIKDMSDNANKMGTSIELIQNAYQGFAKQNYTMLDNLKLGYGGTKTEMERLLADAEKITGIKYDINNLSDVYNAIHVIQGGVDELNGGLGDVSKGLGITGTTATEASTTITGSINAMKGAFDNFLNGSGSAKQLVDSMIVVFKNISGAIVKLAPDIANGLIELVNGLVPEIPTLLQGLLPVVIQGAIELINGLVKSLPTLIPVLMDGLVQAFMGLVKILPTLIDALIKGAIMIIQALAEQLPTMLPAIIDAILQIIPILIDNLPLFLRAGWQLIIGLAQGLIQSIPSLLSNAWQIIISLINYFKQMPGMMIDIGKNLITGLWNGIKNVTGWIINKIKGFGSSVLKAIKGIFGIHSPSKEFEWIGKMNMLGFNEGIENMKNKIQGTIDSTFAISPQLTGSMNSAYSPNVNVQVQNNMSYDPLGQLVNKVKTFSGGAKNDYNWGAGF